MAATSCPDKAKKKGGAKLSQEKIIWHKKIWRRPYLPGFPSTSGAKELNFCVRNGNRWILLAIVTRNYFSFFPSGLQQPHRDISTLISKHVLPSVLLGQALD